MKHYVTAPARHKPPRILRTATKIHLFRQAATINHQIFFKPPSPHVYAANATLTNVSSI